MVTLFDEIEKLRLIHQFGLYSFEDGWSEFCRELDLDNDVKARERAKVFFDEVIPIWVGEDRLQNAPNGFKELFTGVMKQAMIFAFLSGYCLGKS